KRLARVEAISLADDAPKGAAQIVVAEATICLPLGNLIDLSAEKARLEKAIVKTEGEISRINGKLSNEKFVANANPEVVEAERERLEELEGQIASLRIALSRVSEAG
ncbi:valyl-tRNA ligase, partial [Rhizobium sp. Pop5]